MRNLQTILVILLFIFIPQFANAQTANACNLLNSHPNWARSIENANQKWGISKGAILAVIDQESRFRANASNGVNYGFAQSNPRTWNWFLRDAKMGNRLRTDFDASAHFVGWHFKTMSRRLRIDIDNITQNYLAYKMGEGGYRRGASQSARNIANRVAANAHRFDNQLNSCSELFEDLPPLELEN